MSLKSQVSPGLSGIRYEHLQAILFSEHSKADRLAKSAFDELHSLSNDIVQGRLPWYFYQIWNGSSLTALNKKDAADLETNEIMDCRPICKGEAIKKVITKALYKPYMNKIKAGCEPSQFSVGTNGGGSQLIMAITLLLEANPDWVIIALDISNAFNEIQRHSILEELWKDIELKPLWYYNCLLYTSPSPRDKRQSRMPSSA